MEATRELLDLYVAYASEEACCREMWEQTGKHEALFRADHCLDVMEGILRAAKAMRVEPGTLEEAWGSGEQKENNEVGADEVLRVLVESSGRRGTGVESARAVHADGILREMVDSSGNSTVAVSAEIGKSRAYLSVAISNRVHPNVDTLLDTANSTGCNVFVVTQGGEWLHLVK